LLRHIFQKPKVLRLNVGNSNIDAKRYGSVFLGGKRLLAAGLVIDLTKLKVRLVDLR
jgi:hypothetical protein